MKPAALRTARVRTVVPMAVVVPAAHALRINNARRVCAPIRVAAPLNVPKRNVATMAAEVVAAIAGYRNSAERILYVTTARPHVMVRNAVTMVAVEFAETVVAVCPVFWDLASMSVNRTAFLVSAG